MEFLTTTELVTILDTTPQGINRLLQQADVETSTLSRKGLKKVFDPETVKKILSRKGIDYSNKTFLALCNNKGGVGKTTTSVNLAMILASMGFKVLVVDNDPQGNATTYLSSEMHKKTLYDAVARGVAVEEIIVKIKDNLDLIPSNLELNFLDGYFQKQNLNPTTFYKKLFANLDYNFIIWDLSPAINSSNTFALMSCDEIKLVTDLNEFGYQGVEMTLDAILASKEEFENWQPSIEIVINKFDERKVKSLNFLPLLQELAPLNNTILKTDSSIELSQMQKTALPQKSKAYKEMLKFASTLINLHSINNTITH